MNEDDCQQCQECFGKGWNDEFHAVAGHYNGGETFRMECEACDGTGRAAAAMGANLERT